MHMTNTCKSDGLSWLYSVNKLPFVKKENEKISSGDRQDITFFGEMF